MGKIVINKCYGGFSLSEKAIKRYAEIKGTPLYIEQGSWGNIYWTVPKEERVVYLKDDAFINASYEDKIKSNQFYEEHTISSRYFDRTDPILVQVVEELGNDADGDCAELEIIEIPRGTLYRINEYDGYETMEYRDDGDWLIAN